MLIKILLYIMVLYVRFALADMTCLHCMQCMKLQFTINEWPVALESQSQRATVLTTLHIESRLSSCCKQKVWASTLICNIKGSSALAPTKFLPTSMIRIWKITWVRKKKIRCNMFTYPSLTFTICFIFSGYHSWLTDWSTHGWWYGSHIRKIDLEEWWSEW